MNSKHDFVFKEILHADMTEELEKIGFDKSYIHKAKDKYEYKNIKIYSLNPQQAAILKQTALSVGCDCAIHREVITNKIETSDCILGGSIAQLKEVSQKLQHQPFGLKKLGENLIIPPLIEGRNLRFLGGGNTKIVGILNLTDNSFSDGGMYNDFESAKARLIEMIEEGADIIDIGAESTKPFSQAVDDEAQLEKLLPIIKVITLHPNPLPQGERELNSCPPLEGGPKSSISRGGQISVDTRSARVAEECIKAGAQIINDVSGLDYDEKMADIIAKYGVKVIIQHSKGTPENMQTEPEYESVIDEIYLNLRQKIDYAVSKGIKKENIIVDPGIGFGKTRAHNFEILRRIEEFRGLGCPVMIGLSRKSLLNMSECDNLTKDIFTAALNTLAIERKVDYIRVHNVKLHRNLIELMNKF